MNICKAKVTHILVDLGDHFIKTYATYPGGVGFGRQAALEPEFE